MSFTSLAEMAMGFGANTCFGLMAGKWGQKNSGKLGSASIAFGIASLLIGIIGGATREPPVPPLTREELDEALENLRAEIADDAFNLTMTTQISPVLSLAKGYTHAFNDGIRDVRGHGTNDPVADDILAKDWAEYYDAYKKEVIDGTRCLPFLEFIKAADQRKLKTISAYQMAAGLYLNIAQLCLLVEWNDICRDPKFKSTYIKEMKQYRKDYKQWKKDYNEWQTEKLEEEDAKHPHYGPSHRRGFNPYDTLVAAYATGDPDYSAEPHAGEAGGPERPTPPTPPPEMYNELYTSVFAAAIRDNVPDFISYADAVVSELEARVARRGKLHEKLMTIASKTVSGTAGTFTTYEPTETYGSTRDCKPPIGKIDGQVHNPKTGLYFTAQSRDVATRQADVLVGIELAGLQSQGVEDLGDISPADVIKQRKVIDLWQQTLESYALPE